MTEQSIECSMESRTLYEVDITSHPGVIYRTRREKLAEDDYNETTELSFNMAHDVMRDFLDDTILEEIQSSTDYCKLYIQFSVYVFDIYNSTHPMVNMARHVTQTFFTTPCKSDEKELEEAITNSFRRLMLLPIIQSQEYVTLDGIKIIAHTA